MEVVRGLQNGGLYRLLADPVAFVHSNGKLDKPSTFKNAYAEYIWWDVMEIASKGFVESMNDSKVLVDGSVGEYQNRVVGFLSEDGADLDESIAMVARGFHWREVLDLFEGVSLVEGF